MVRKWWTTLAVLAVAGGSVGLSGPASAAVAAPTGAPVTATARAGTGLAATGLAATALARAPHQPGGLMVRPHVAPALGLAHGHKVTVSESENWSGYAAVGSYKSVSATWTQPGATCTSGDQYSSFWVGLDGFLGSSNTVEQTGTDADCAGKRPLYYSWYEMYPAYPVNFRNPVTPGDKFFGSVTWVKHTTYTLVLKDLTRGWAHTVTASVAGAANSSAEVIAEAPCCTNNGGILPLTDFNSMSFGHASANGLPISDAADLQEMIMADAKGTQQDTVTDLAGGNAFSVTWLHST